jgi:hypothetical protein
MIELSPPIALTRHRMTDRVCISTKTPNLDNSIADIDHQNISRLHRIEMISMSMTPIHKIPLEADSPSLVSIVKGELDMHGAWNIPQAFLNSLAHDQNEDHLSIMMDWAMQIRQEMGISWGECINAASILYYG